MRSLGLQLRFTASSALASWKLFIKKPYNLSCK
jgi:hypothetical protein